MYQWSENNQNWKRKDCSLVLSSNFNKVQIISERYEFKCFSDSQDPWEALDVSQYFEQTKTYFKCRQSHKKFIPIEEKGDHHLKRYTILYADIANKFKLNRLRKNAFSMIGPE